MAEFAPSRSSLACFSFSLAAFASSASRRNLSIVLSGLPEALLLGFAPAAAAAAAFAASFSFFFWRLRRSLFASSSSLSLSLSSSLSLLALLGGFTAPHFMLSRSSARDDAGVPVHMASSLARASASRCRSFSALRWLILASTDAWSIAALCEDEEVFELFFSFSLSFFFLSSCSSFFVSDCLLDAVSAAGFDSDKKSSRDEPGSSGGPRSMRSIKSAD
mmetsp:Transcript_20954/g.42228  ORF Transcript_20954/g.42228 Transcript_20954/m.42228 type:complete len:219 (+) Transcript_20954:419-1075(+)